MGTYDPVPGETAYGLPVYKKRGTEHWLQCSGDLSKWIIQPKECRLTRHGYCFSPAFLNIYEYQLPHEMTDQWSINSIDNVLIKIDVKITILPSPSPACGFVVISPV